MRTAVRAAFRLSPVFLVALATPASAQLISIRTVPLAQADQFDIYPSNNLGMGGVSIALPDTLLDPFSNPAKASRLRGARFFGSPTVYSVSSNAGGGRTLPLGAFARAGRWFGGFSAAVQQVDAARTDFFFPGPILDIRQPGTGGTILPGQQQTGLSDRSHGNLYAVMMAGTTLPESRLSLAGSVSLANLHAVDGVDLLYAGSQGVAQDGYSADLRLGLLKEWQGGQTLEAVVLHNRFGMAHDVTWLDFVWDPGSQQTVGVPRLEQNVDRTRTWAAHVELERPLPAPGWRIGWVTTVNRMSHPKLPNYQIQQVQSIPRDPGYSTAWNFGIGLSRVHGPMTFGLDAIYEPIRSNTWADAATPVPTSAGDTIPAGGRTIENHFRFSNALFRMGFTRDLELSGPDKGLAMQLGLVVRSIRYRLMQENRVQASRRNQREAWIEWTPTWGLKFRFPELEIRYQGRVTHGTGRPGVAGFGGGVPTLDAAGGARGIIVAPNGPLALDEVSVVTHQISISLPIR